MSCNDSFQSPTIQGFGLEKDQIHAEKQNQCNKSLTNDSYFVKSTEPSAVCEPRFETLLSEVEVDEE